MLKQKVNLYRSVEVKPSIEFLPLDKLISMQKYFLIFLLLTYIVMFFDVISLYFKSYYQPKNTALLSAQYEKIKMTFPDLSQASNIQQSIQDMEKEIQEKKRKLNNVLSPYSWMFSQGLLSISESSNNLMWVSELNFDFEKNNSFVNGYAFSLDDINAFSKLLNNNQFNQKNMININAVDKVSTVNGDSVYKFAIQLIGNA